METVYHDGKYEFHRVGNTVTIFRERNPTKQEKEKDPDAKMFVEVVEITFSDSEPKIVINRNFCE